MIALPARTALLPLQSQLGYAHSALDGTLLLVLNRNSDSIED